MKFTWSGRSTNSACDAGSGEKYLFKSSRLVSSEEACKKSCEDEVRCQSITYHYYTKVCKHYSTDCEKTTSILDAIAIRLKDHLDNNEECDVSKGEIRLSKSSGKVSSLAACRKSCEDVSACQSITLFSDGQCQHFSTKCENRKSHAGAIALRLKDHDANDKECDTSQGEVYMQESSRVTHSLAACMKSCQAVPTCHGITFYARGWCSHFSTACEKTKVSKDAHARKIPTPYLSPLLRPLPAHPHSQMFTCSSFNLSTNNAPKNDATKYSLLSVCTF